MMLVNKICTSLIVCFAVVGILNSCKNNAVSLNKIQQMMDSVANNISSQGAKAWLNYFENTPSFFMASDGKLVFPDYNAATKFISDTLANIISNINLNG